MINKKILIISYYWPPSGRSGVQRWLNFSNQLSVKGWDITVFTALNPKYPLIDNTLPKSVNKSIKVVKIPIFEPTSFLKSNNSDNIKADNIFSKILLWIRANLFFPDSRMFWIKKVSRKATDYIKKNDINYLITTAPPFSTHLIGLNIKKNTDVKWISDFRDPWSGFFQFKLLPLLTFQRKRHLKAELQCLNFSDTVITTSPSLTLKYSLINSNCHTVFNGFNSFIKTKDSDGFLLMYSGVMKSIQNPINLWSVLEEISLENGGSKFKWAKTTEERNKLWQARHDVYYSVKAEQNNIKVYTTDICVPISNLVEAIKFAEIEIKNYGLRAPMVGHVGDGNFHVAIQYDPADKNSYKIIREFSNKLIQKALDLEGTVTGEHGIGVHKKEYLVQQHNDNLPYMKLIKKSFDPNNIMNPGKIFD